MCDTAWLKEDKNSTSKMRRALVGIERKITGPQGDYSRQM